MSDENERPIASEGSVQKPVAWACLNEEIVSLRAEIARLRLTDEEREAVECELGWIKDRNTKHADTLRKLLERLK